MSKSQIREKMQKALLKNFKKEEGKKLAEYARDLNQSDRVRQCLVINAESIEQLTVGFEAGINNILDGTTRREYKTFLRTKLRQAATPWKPLDPKDAYFERMVKDAGLKLTGASPTVLHFTGTYRNVKNTIHAIARKFAADLDNADEYSATRAGASYNLDHGKHGTSSGLLGAAMGAGAMRARSQKGKRENDKLSDEDFADKVVENFVWVMEDQLKRVVSDELKTNIHSLVMHWEQYIDKNGNLNADFSLLLTPVSDRDNKAEAAIEKDIQQAFIDAYHMTFDNLEYEKLEGSSSLLQKMEKFIVHDCLLKQIKNKTLVKVTSSINKNISLKTGTNLKETKGINQKTKLKKITVSGGKKARRPSGMGETAGKQQPSMFNLMAMINQKLPGTVKKNMKAPRLENRTGRLADSVKITDVTTTAQGFPSFGYTYEKDPYQVYESGRGKAPWADGQRDPRALIDASIREIAANLALGRFYTRRV